METNKEITNVCSQETIERIKSELDWIISIHKSRNSGRGFDRFAKFFKTKINLIGLYALKFKTNTPKISLDVSVDPDRIRIDYDDMNILNYNESKLYENQLTEKTCEFIDAIYNEIKYAYDKYQKSKKEILDKVLESAIKNIK